MPEHLISAEHLDLLMAEHQPRILPTATSTSKEDIPVIPSDEPSEQIMQFQLSNGIKVNARRTLNEPKAAMLRMIAAGGSPLIRPPHSVSLLHSSSIVGHQLWGSLRCWRQSGNGYYLTPWHLVTNLLKSCLSVVHINTNQFRSWPSASSTHCFRVQSVNVVSTSCQIQQTACWSRH